jgi:hypothetical protein
MIGVIIIPEQPPVYHDFLHSSRTHRQVIVVFLFPVMRFLFLPQVQIASPRQSGLFGGCFLLFSSRSYACFQRDKEKEEKGRKKHFKI